MIVMSARSLCKMLYRASDGKDYSLAQIPGLKGFVVGKCVGGARRGQMATVCIGPYDFEC